MSHRYTKKQIESSNEKVNQTNGNTNEEVQKPTTLNKMQNASNVADKFLIFFHSGVLKTIFGVLFILVGLVSIVGLVEVWQNTESTDPSGKIYFSIATPFYILLGIALLIWYYKKNVKQKTLETTKENLKKINEAEAKRPQVKQKSVQEQILEKQKKENNKK